MLEITKFILFSIVMVCAAIVDCKLQIVYKRTYILLFLVGLINADISAIIGMAIIFIPLFASGLMFGGIGGGDIKTAALCGFVLKTGAALIGIGLGLLLGAIIPNLYRMAKGKRELNGSVPLIPFLAAGTIFAYLCVL